MICKLNINEEEKERNVNLLNGYQRLEHTSLKTVNLGFQTPLTATLSVSPNLLLSSPTHHQEISSLFQDTACFHKLYATKFPRYRPFVWVLRTLFTFYRKYMTDCGVNNVVAVIGQNKSQVIADWSGLFCIIK